MNQREADALLFQAAQTGKVSDAEAAFEAGANVTATMTEKLTPLHVAARNGHSGIATLLIDKGADVNAETLDKQTPLHFAARDGKEGTATILIASGANLNAKSELVIAETPRDTAVRSNRTNIVELLDDAARIVEHAAKQGHARRVAKERKDKGPPQVGG